MVQCQSCHFESINTAGLALHIQGKHGFSWQAARIEAARVSGDPYFEDEIVFGKDAWVYCNQHMKPHQTGWCSVSPRDKVGLGVDTAEAAYAKCRDWGFELYKEH